MSLSSMLSSEATLVLLAGAVIFAAALVSSVAGFAFAALAGAALLNLFPDPVHAVSVIVACSIAIQAYAVWSMRRMLAWRRIAPFVIGGIATVPVGVAMLTRVPAAAFAAGLGAFLSVYALYMLLRRDAPRVAGGWRMDALFGALGGITGGLAGFPGGLVTLWCGMRGWTKEEQRAVYQPYILLMQLETLLCLHAQAPWSLSLAPLLFYVPAALVAASVGLAIFRRLSSRQFAVAVNVLLLVSGIALLAGAA